jgi:hypothetical protein
MPTLEGPGSDDRLKRVQQGFRNASRGVRFRAWLQHWWALVALIIVAALYVAYKTLSGQP